MPEFNIDAPEDPVTPAQPELKPWSTPRVIVSNFASTEAGVSAVPEVSSGVFIS